MCGIVGYIQKQEDRSTLPRMIERVAHRGPDGKGSIFSRHGDWWVALGHQRLSIIDLESGDQPMGNEDGRLQIVFNGEIYNFKQLREQLTAQGHAFKTRSDTEVIVHHIEENGVEGLPALDGILGFGLWNGRLGELLLARDRAGIKPLYYVSLPDGGIAFGSELAALLVHPGVSRKLSHAGLLSYFFSDYAQAPLSMVEGIRKLAPGEYLIWKPAQTRSPKTYWKLEGTGKKPPEGSTSEICNQLLEQLEGSVISQLVSDVPVGAFLSGGIDSSVITLLAQQNHQRPMQTFSLGFKEASFDESSYAREVAKRIGSDHTEEILAESNLLEIVDSSLDRLDEPLADPSYLPTYLPIYLCRGWPPSM